MSTIELAGSFPNPKHLGRAGIVQTRSWIHPSKRLFIRQMQALMGSPKTDGWHYRMMVHRNSSSRHKFKALVHSVRQFTVPMCIPYISHTHTHNNQSIIIRMVFNITFFFCIIVLYYVFFNYKPSIDHIIDDNNLTNIHSHFLSNSLWS